MPSQHARGRALRWVVGLGVVVGGLIGGLAVAELGPFAEQPAAPEPTFDPAVYADQPQPLDLAMVLASSTREPRGEIRYDAALMTDEDLSTAWNSVGGPRPDGVGESLSFTLAQPAWVSGLVIGNGYQKDDRSFVANARLRRVRVSLGGDAVYDVSILDQPGRQVVDFGEPVLADHVNVEVLESYPGDTYQDLAVSELVIRGWATVGSDRDRFSPEALPSEAG
ncbi:MAG TPA: discoidin domain-containing protein [Nitriliruptorales bacterium]